MQYDLQYASVNYSSVVICGCKVLCNVVFFVSAEVNILLCVCVCV